MIEKIISIRNVGKFVNYKPKGDVGFRKLTLVYGENGRGKTTLCDILRSFAIADGNRIIGRKTLGSDLPPLVEILVSGAKRTFSNGSWCQPLSQLSIFDSAFVHENIYAGDIVDHEHKKNLYRVIVGENGVQLAKKIDELDDSIRECNKQLKSTSAAIERLLPKGMGLQQFILLEEDVDVESKIKDLERVFAALSESDAIKSRACLETVPLPMFPSDLESLLNETFDGISPNAEQVIRNHLNNHMANGQEQWISSGISMVKENACPFCGQNIDGIALISSYRLMFSKAYQDLKERLLKSLHNLNQSLGSNFIPMLQKVLAENRTSIEFWNRFIFLDESDIASEIGDIKESIEYARIIAEGYLKQKITAPLESINFDNDFATAKHRVEESRLKLSDYNTFIKATNELIDNKKRQVDSGDIKNTELRLHQLKAKRSRQDPTMNDSCEDYKRLVNEKVSLEKKKEALKVELDDYSDSIFGQYENRINKLLQMFNAGFRIAGTKRRYIGGTPSSSYEIMINDVQIPVGDKDTNLASPCFKNTLSSGDRSTLALAFFLAQLESKPELHNTVVVFDDPFTSQDRSRRTCTQQHINRLVSMVKQVIVLSHETAFLQLVWEGELSKEKKTLQLTRLGQNTTITEWDISMATRGNYEQMHHTLSQFRDHGTGDKRSVAQMIRPLLESYLRIKLPMEFNDREWLGDFIKKIRESDTSSPASAAKEILLDIESINDFSKRFHHDTKSAADSEDIDDGELDCFVKKTLQIVGGF